MGILSWLGFKKRTPPTHNYDFVDYDRETSLSVRRFKSELKKLDFEREKLIKEAELLKIRADFDELKQKIQENQEDSGADDDDEPEEDDFVVELFKKYLLNNALPSQAQGVIGAANVPSTAQAASMSLPEKILPIFKDWASENDISSAAQIDLWNRIKGAN